MRRSIRRRLVVLTAASSAALVGLVCAGVWWRMGRVLRDELDAGLYAEALALSRLIEDDEGRIQFELDTAILREPGLRGGGLLLIRAADGRVIVGTQTPDVDAAFGRALDAATADAATFLDFLLEGQPFRAVALTVVPRRDPEHAQPDAEAAPAVRLCLARPLAPLHQTLAQLGWALSGAALAALLAALLVGWRVAAVGVRPIRRVADVIAKTLPGAARLEFDAAEAPLELDPIVEKTNVLLGRIRAELARQRELTADVAHDLRTPVAGVRTLLDVCLSRPRSAAEYQEALTTALAALRELSRLLDDVLTMARLDAAVERPRAEAVRLADVVAAGVRAVQPLSAARRVRVEVSPFSDGALLSDPVRLEKIVVNLLSNAIEHSPDESAVDVSFALERDRVELHVRDRGRGVPPEQRERIFERFVRGDEARPGDGHHGLGLPIARGLARLLGGDLRLQASSEAGSHFVLTLPRAESQSHA